jgi:hypothetical protein
MDRMQGKEQFVNGQDSAGIEGQDRERPAGVGRHEHNAIFKQTPIQVGYVRAGKQARAVGLRYLRRL